MTDQVRGSDPQRGEDEVDGAIDEVLDGRAAVGEGASEVTAVLLRVRALAGEPLPQASRARHLSRIGTRAPAADTARVRPRGARRRLVAVGAATALLVVSGGGAVAAAQDARPDDALYGLKRTSERVWLALPGGSGRAADVHLALAERRIREAREAPDHAPRLVAEGLENVEEAAEERPEKAIENFKRLLGDGDDRLPDQASPAARAALHRNCVRIADKHGLGAEQCGAAPEVAHPGRGRGQSKDVPPGQTRGQGGEDRGSAGEPGGRGLGRAEKDGPRGWGPGGRPDGVVGPPPGTPGHERRARRDDASA